MYISVNVFAGTGPGWRGGRLSGDKAKPGSGFHHLRRPKITPFPPSGSDVKSEKWGVFYAHSDVKPGKYPLRHFVALRRPKIGPFPIPTAK